jgi:hypothetical protein
MAPTAAVREFFLRLAEADDGKAGGASGFTATASLPSESSLSGAAA